MYTSKDSTGLRGKRVEDEYVGRNGVDWCEKVVSKPGCDTGEEAAVRRAEEDHSRRKVLQLSSSDRTAHAASFVIRTVTGTTTWDGLNHTNPVKLVSLSGSQ